MKIKKTLVLVRRFFVALVAFALSTLTTSAPAADVGGGPQRGAYVIVHGAFGGGWDWRLVERELTPSGRTVYRPTLTGQGERAHLSSLTISLTTHIDDIVNVILYENLHDVVLVGHSYGGMVITGVMERIPERLSRVIFLDALVPEDGESANEFLRLIDHPGFPVLKGLMTPTWLQPGAGLPRDVAQSERTFTEPVSFKNPAALKLPATCVIFIEKGGRIDSPDNDSSAKWRRLTASRARARGWKIETLESDHVAERTHVNELAALLLTIVGPAPR